MDAVALLEVGWRVDVNIDSNVTLPTVCLSKGYMSKEKFALLVSPFNGLLSPGSQKKINYGIEKCSLICMRYPSEATYHQLQILLLRSVQENQVAE